MRWVQITKDFLIFTPFVLFFYPLKHLFIFIGYLVKLNLWIRKNKNAFVIKCKYQIQRNYNLRYGMYDQITEYFKLESAPLLYLEYGVSQGFSFKYWLNKNSNSQSRFFGFDTFEGLPENWGGFYKVGDMASDIPRVEDSRAEFIKGLFQNTLCNFLKQHQELMHSGIRKIIHMDADLYSATAFTLSQLFPYLKSGDLILFDEFNVPLHEFKAFEEFEQVFQIKLKPIIAVNNYYHVAFQVTSSALQQSKEKNF